jgi:hypothetical protein
MKLLFIAGPFTGDGKEETKRKNLKNAKDFAITLARHNIPFYCPHINYMELMLDEKLETSVKLFCKIDARIFDSLIDGVLALPGWEESVGAKAEIEKARKRNLAIFYPKDTDDLQEIIFWAKI